MKQIIHIGLAAAINPHAKGLEIISLAATGGIDNDIFQANILPSNPFPKGLSRYWARHEEEWEKITTSPVPPREAAKEFHSWLTRYHGTHLAVCSALEFVGVFNLLVEQIGKCTFGTQGHLDSRTLIATQQQDYSLRGAKFAEEILPINRAVKRWKLISQSDLVLYDTTARLMESMKTSKLLNLVDPVERYVQQLVGQRPYHWQPGYEAGNDRLAPPQRQARR